MALNINYYPNDLIHLILATHCASETGSDAGNLKVKTGDPVIFNSENKHYKFYIKNKNFDLNKLLTDWVATEVIEDVYSGYVGIIYTNSRTKQIVLAHRSTNFGSDLKMASLFKVKESGIQTDINTVLMGMILKYQEQGYYATETALKYSLEKGYALSITGHSLGAWLAGMSAYYCNTIFVEKYPQAKYVKIFSFDGPGSLEMMKKISESGIGEADLEAVYIVEYLSPVNIINAANKHIGTVYRLLPDIEANILELLREEVEEKGNNDGLVPSFLDWLKETRVWKWIEAKLGIRTTYDGLMATFGHDLRYILLQFDPMTGRPKHYEGVKSWPSISYKNFGSASKGPLSDLIDRALRNLVRKDIISSFVGSFTKSVDTTTLGSMFTLISEYKKGNIKDSKFWKVYECLSKMTMNITNDSYKADFCLKIKALYRTVPVNEYVLKGELRGCDKYFKVIKQNVNKINKGTNHHFASDIASFAELYYYTADGSVVIKDEYRQRIHINQLRDTLRGLLSNHPEEFATLLHDGLSMLYTPTNFVLLNGNSSGVLPLEGGKALTDFCLGQQPNWVDFDGDGKLDLLCSDRREGTYFVLLFNGTTFKSPNKSMSGILYIEGGQKPLRHWCMKSEYNVNDAEDRKIIGQLALIDFNGDGKIDLACNTANGTHYVLESTGENLKSVNEDTRGELKLWKENDVKGAPITTWCSRTKNRNLELRWIDFNGDKMSDLLCYNTVDGQYQILFSIGVALKAPSQSTSRLYIEGQEQALTKWCVKENKNNENYGTNLPVIGKLRVTDFNGDKKMDLVCSSPDGNHYALLLINNTLNSANGDPSGELKLQGVMNYKALYNWCPTGGGLELNLLDFNGDGRADFVCYGAGELKVLLSDDGKRLRSIDPNHPDGKLKITGDHGIYAKHCTARNMYWIDINKDNKTDILCFTKDNAYALLSNGESLEFKLIYEKQESKNLCLEHIGDNSTVIAFGNLNGDNLIDIICSREGSHVALLGWNKLSDEHSAVFHNN